MSSGSNQQTSEEVMVKLVYSPTLRRHLTLLRKEEGATIIYTDGALSRRNKTSGVGYRIEQPNRDPRDISKAIDPNYTKIPEIEILAIQYALRDLRYSEDFDNGPVIVRTDHYMIIQALQMKELRPGNKQFEQLRTLKETAKSFPKGVQFEHVYARTGNKGNNKADELAKAATGNYRTSSSRSNLPSEKMLKRTRKAYVKGKASLSQLSPPKPMKVQAVNSQVSTPQPSDRRASKRNHYDNDMLAEGSSVTAKKIKREH